MISIRVSRIWHLSFEYRLMLLRENCIHIRAEVTSSVRFRLSSRIAHSPSIIAPSEEREARRRNRRCARFIKQTPAPAPCIQFIRRDSRRSKSMLGLLARSTFSFSIESQPDRIRSHASKRLYTVLRPILARE